MSLYSSSEMWKARVTPWAKIGLLALAECSAGGDDDVHSTYMGSSMRAFMNLTRFPLAEAEEFLFYVLDIDSENGVGFGSGVDFWLTDVITRAEQRWPSA